MSRMTGNCAVCTKPLDTERISYGGESFGTVLPGLADYITPRIFVYIFHMCFHAYFRLG